MFKKKMKSKGMNLSNLAISSMVEDMPKGKSSKKKNNSFLDSYKKRK